MKEDGTMAEQTAEKNRTCSGQANFEMGWWENADAKRSFAKSTGLLWSIH